MGRVSGVRIGLVNCSSYTQSVDAPQSASFRFALGSGGCVHRSGVAIFGGPPPGDCCGDIRLWIKWCLHRCPLDAEHDARACANMLVIHDAGGRKSWAWLTILSRYGAMESWAS